MTTGPQKGYMPTPQKGYYNEANDKENLLDGTPTENAGNDKGGDGEKVTTSTDAKENTYSGYDDILAMVQEAQKRTKEDEETARRQERLARAHSFISGIGDLGRALANMYFTTQYAPNGYDHNKDSLSEKAKARADKWRAERQRLQKEYYNYAMQGANAKVGRERAKAADERAKEQQAYRDKQLDLYYQREESKKRMADLQEKYKNRQLDLKEAEIELRKWIEQGKMSRSQINHNLASWKRTKRYIFNDRGKKIGEEEERIVMNPDGTLTTESSIKYDDGQGGGSSQQGGNNAPPSRRRSGGENNTPPSRRK